MSSPEIQPFQVQVPQAELDELKARLARTRWPDEIPNSGWQFGSNLAYMRELTEYWRTEFDWRAQERAINRFAHFRADVGGLGIHFIHEHGKGPKPLPLIITHGWPGTFHEMAKIIPLLADPAGHGGDAADAFDVVAPSLPGYGFSDHPKEAGMTRARIADLWARLMTEGLGYERFGAHGGDIGATVTSCLGLNYPERLVGIHVTAVVDPYLGPGSEKLSSAEEAHLETIREWERVEGAYGHLQGSKPQTPAYALNDSPAGLAAWIVEKFRSWSECEGEVERRFSKDEMLTHITLYWVTQSIGSSFRLYYDSRNNPSPFQAGLKIRVPCGVCLTREEVDLAPREWAERTYNVHRWTEMPRGGHFAALEEPELLVEDIRAFFRPLRG